MFKKRINEWEIRISYEIDCLLKLMLFKSIYMKADYRDYKLFKDWCTKISPRN